MTHPEAPPTLPDRLPLLPGRALSRIARIPLLHKILLVNAVVVVGGAITGMTVALRHGALHPGHPHYGLMSGFAAVGLAVSLVLNYLVLRAVLRPLDNLQGAVDAIRAGGSGVRVATEGLPDERLGRLADTFNSMVTAIEEQAEHLKHLPGRILGAQEEERRRIARELHDEAAQSMTSLLVRLRLLEQARTPERAQERVTELRELAARALEDVRRIAVELRPAVLDDLGLTAALHAYVDDLNAVGPTQIEFLCEGCEGRMRPEVELALFRVAQEALTNMRRHAGASRAWVRLRRGEDRIELEVRDDGVGITPSVLRPGRGGLGISGMRERMALIGGELTIRSSPGGGTAVAALAPDRVSSSREGGGNG